MLTIVFTKAYVCLHSIEAARESMEVIRMAFI